MIDKSKIKIAFLSIFINASGLREPKPDFMLMDVQMPGLNGIDAMRLIKENFPEIKILMETIFEEDKKTVGSLRNAEGETILKNTVQVETSKVFEEDPAPRNPGISGKVMTILKSRISPVNNKNEKLSLREKEILSCLAEGMSYKMIASKCFISIDTVSGHMRNIYKKLQVHSKGEAVAKAIRGKIV